MRKLVTIWMLCYAALVPFAPGQGVAKGFSVPANTISPNGRYGVTIPLLAEEENIDDPTNSLVDAKTGTSLGMIKGGTGWDRMNRGGVLPARWSTDNKYLLWEVEGRFSPRALTLVKVANDKIVWQIDVLATFQRAILSRTQRAAPKKYKAAMAWNKGNGSAYPDGFTVNVRAKGDKARGGEGAEDVKGLPISFPLRVHAELTSNPKQIESCPQDAQLDAALDGTITAAGKVATASFRLRKEPFDNATDSAWLALVNPLAATDPPLTYGDVVNLKGKVTTEQDQADKPVYLLHLDHRISVPASADAPAERNVTVIRLLGFDKFPAALPIDPADTYDVDGTLGHSRTNAGPVLTLVVHEYGFGRR